MESEHNMTKCFHKWVWVEDDLTNWERAYWCEHCSTEKVVYLDVKKVYGRTFETR